MVAPPKYKLWQQLIIGAAAAAFIQPSAFYGSFIDCLMAMPLGALLVLVQVLVSRNDLYSSLFECVAVSSPLPQTTYSPARSVVQDRHCLRDRLPGGCPRLDQVLLLRRRRLWLDRPHPARLHRPVRLARAREPFHHLRSVALVCAPRLEPVLTSLNLPPSLPTRLRPARLRDPVLALPRLRSVDWRRDLPAHYGPRHCWVRRRSVVHVQLAARRRRAVVQEHDPAVVVYVLLPCVSQWAGSGR